MFNHLCLSLHVFNFKFANFFMVIKLFLVVDLNCENNVEDEKDTLKLR